MSKCKSCGKEIKFIPTAHHSFIPCDLPSVRYMPERGSDTVIVTERGAVIKADIVTPNVSPFVGYIPHWATCPNADSHRRGKKQDTDDGQLSM